MAEGPVPAGDVGDLLVALIRNRCVNDGTPESGQEARSVATLADYLGEPGRVFEPAPGRQSVLYRVPGRRAGAPRLMLCGHLDVVPADPGGWAVDPFEGVRSGGWIWGRGAVDMLNVTAAMAAAFRRRLHGVAPPLPGDLLFLATADEESGSGLGAALLVERHWDEVACEFLLTEIAHPAFDEGGGRVVPVTVAEKGPYWRRLVAAGTPGHGSQPYGADNAVVRLAAVVEALASGTGPAHLAPEWRRFAEATGLDEWGLAHLDTLEDALAGLRDRPALARWAHACTHLTVSPNVLRGGTKANVIPDRAMLEVDVRAVPGQDARTADGHLAGVLEERGEGRVSVEPVLEFPPTASEPEGPLWEAVAEALGASAVPVPALVPVSTDARFFRARGTVAYGVGLYDEETDFSEFLAMFHGNDERVSEASLGRTAGFLDDLLDRFGDRT